MKVIVYATLPISLEKTLLLSLFEEYDDSEGNHHALRTRHALESLSADVTNIMTNPHDEAFAIESARQDLEGMVEMSEYVGADELDDVLIEFEHLLSCVRRKIKENKPHGDLMEVHLELPNLLILDFRTKAPRFHTRPRRIRSLH